MNAREKVLAGVVLSGVVIFGGGLGVRAVILQPLKEIDSQTAQLRSKIRDLEQERREFFVAEDLVKNSARRTFADDPNHATALAGALLTEQIAAAGLRVSDFTRIPVGPAKLPGAKEVGWTLQGEGPLAKVIDLLYALENSPSLHRIENLVLTSGDPLGRVRVRLRYLALVIDPAPDVERTLPSPDLPVDSPERRLYRALVDRDILRPYVKRKSAPSKEGPAVTQGSTGPAPAKLKVVSLSEWNGRPEIHVRNLDARTTRVYTTGDTLLDGQVVMVDYRPLPLPRYPELKSYSRVILKKESEYWAVEAGQTLAEQRRLDPSQWPAELKEP